VGGCVSVVHRSLTLSKSRMLPSSGRRSWRNYDPLGIPHPQSRLVLRWLDVTVARNQEASPIGERTGSSGCRRLGGGIVAARADGAEWRPTGRASQAASASVVGSLGDCQPLDRLQRDTYQ
jgi:hypothetical protein